MSKAAEFTELVSQQCRAGPHKVGVLLGNALADGPANIVARQVAHAKRPHGHAKLLQRLVDLLDGGPFFEHLASLAAVAANHAVTNKAVAHARYHRRLLDLLGQLHDGEQHIVGCFGATHHFEQLHHIGWAKEVGAHHVLGALGEAGDLIEVQCGRVGRQNGARFADAVELLEHGLLDIHVLKHRFNDQVNACQIAIAQRGR